MVFDDSTHYNSKDAEEAYGVTFDLDQADPVRPNFGLEADTASESSQSSVPAADPKGIYGDPGTTVLIENLGLNYTDLHFPHHVVSFA